MNGLFNARCGSNSTQETKSLFLIIFNIMDICTEHLDIRP
jgi:hypothetical protein